MSDYRKMYDILFNAITDVVSLLQQAQQHTEALYIDSEDAECLNVHVLKNQNNEE